jgi:uncharacterized protein YbgA (DUF1722 family)
LANFYLKFNYTAYTSFSMSLSAHFLRVLCSFHCKYSFVLLAFSKYNSSWYTRLFNFIAPSSSQTERFCAYFSSRYTILTMTLLSLYCRIDYVNVFSNNGAINVSIVMGYVANKKRRSVDRNSFNAIKMPSKC